MHKPLCGGCRSAAAPGRISWTKASQCVCGTARVLARDARTDVRTGAAVVRKQRQRRQQLRDHWRACGREMQTRPCLKGRWKILWAYPQALSPRLAGRPRTNFDLAWWTRHGAAAENEPNAVKPRSAVLGAGLLLGCSEMLRTRVLQCAQARESRAGIRRHGRRGTC